MIPIPNLRTYGYRALVASSAIILSFSVVAVMDSRSAIAEETSLEQRIQKIEDEKQIRDLMVQYGQYLDTLDFAGYSQLFAKNGEWSGQLSEFTTIKGPESIRAAMEKAFAERTYDPDDVTNVHLISNVKIDVQADRASGYSKWTVLSRDGSDKPYVRLNGRYDDVYIREGGRWKFLSRTARREIP